MTSKYRTFQREQIYHDHLEASYRHTRIYRESNQREQNSINSRGYFLINNDVKIIYCLSEKTYILYMGMSLIQKSPQMQGEKEKSIHSIIFFALMEHKQYGLKTFLTKNNVKTIYRLLLKPHTICLGMSFLQKQHKYKERQLNIYFILVCALT